MTSGLLAGIGAAVFVLFIVRLALRQTPGYTTQLLDREREEEGI